MTGRAMHTLSTRRLTPHRLPWIALAALILVTLACTSNDTLFIKLTPTPVPSATPTPLAVETRFKIKDKVYLVGSGFQITMSADPGPVDSQAAAMTTCFANIQVDVLDASKNTSDPKDPTIYYKVQCAAATGWVPEYWLTPLSPSGSAVVKSKDGKGAMLYSNPDADSQPAAPRPCADDTTVTISGLTLNPDATPQKPDNNIYVQVTCGNTTGYALESALVPASS